VISTYDLVVALLSVGFGLGTVGVCLYQKCFLRYYLLNLYVLISAFHTVGALYVIRTYGFTSEVYFWFYYGWDAIAICIAYVLIGSFFDQMLRHSIFRQYVRPTLGIFFFLLLGVSWLYISRSSDHLYSRFIFEFEQNMFFVGVLLTFLLWISMIYLGAETRRLALLVSGIGIYFAAHAANYAAGFLFPGLEAIAGRIPPLAYNLMVLVWLYTFLFVPEGEAAAVPVPRRKLATANARLPKLE